MERWREEKARRMVAWINNSQLTGYWGSETPWWKVMLREVEAVAAAAAAAAQEEEGDKGHKASSRSRGLKDRAANEADDSAAATMSFFDSLNVVEHGDGDGEGAKDAPDDIDSGVVAARAKGYR